MKFQPLPRMKYPEANLLPVGPAVIVENKNGEADAQLYALKGTEEISCLGYEIYLLEYFDLGLFCSLIGSS